MSLAFGESLTILAMLVIMAVSLCAVGLYLYLCAISQARGIRLRVAAGVAGFLLLAQVIFVILRGDIEYNPMIRSSAELVGEYVGGIYLLKLHSDGTYTATGFQSGESGEWSNFDFNLTLTGLQLSQPRIITRNGTICIAPFYAGVDLHHGVLLKKQ